MLARLETAQPPAQGADVIARAIGALALIARAVIIRREPHREAGGGRAPEYSRP